MPEWVSCRGKLSKKLYEWQEEALKLFLDKKHLLVSSATGSGKSIFAIECIKAIQKINSDYRILIVVPKIVLLEDTWIKELYSSGFFVHNVGLFYGKLKQFNKITLTTIASLSRIPLDTFEFCIFDEIHNLYSDNLRKYLKHNFKYKLGLSATIDDSNARHWKILRIFDNNFYQFSIGDALKADILTPYKFFNIGVNITDQGIQNEYDALQKEIGTLFQSIGGIHKFHFTPNDNPLKIHILNKINKRNKLIFNYERKLGEAVKICKENPKKKIIIFNQYNAINRKLKWLLLDVGIHSCIMDSGVSEKEKMNSFNKYERGEVNVLITSRMLDEGWNVKNIDCCIILSGFSTARQTIQRVGRILRKNKNKLFSFIYQIYVNGTFETKVAEERSKIIRKYANKCEEQII